MPTKKKAKKKKPCGPRKYVSVRRRWAKGRSYCRKYAGGRGTKCTEPAKWSNSSGCKKFERDLKKYPIMHPKINPLKSMLGGNMPQVPPIPFG